MDKKLPYWVLICAGFIPLVFLGFLLIWLASTKTATYEESKNADSPVSITQEASNYEFLTGEHSRKIGSIQTHELLFLEQKEKELNQTRLDTEDQVQLLQAHEKLSKM